MRIEALATPILAAMIVGTLCALVVQAQSGGARGGPPIQNPTRIVEAASIRPSDSTRCGAFPTIDGHGARADMTCLTPKFMVQVAYGVRNFQILGGPGWLGTMQYDIAAKAAPSSAKETGAGKNVDQLTDDERKASGERLRALLRSLLADRFQLKVHRETKELPLYYLTTARGGPKLKSNNGASDISGGLRLGTGFLAGSQERVEFLAQTLSQIVGRPVLDRSGLMGKYDFELRWTPEQGSANGPLGDALPPASDPMPDDPNLPTIFTAVKEQLGLKLDSGKGPAEVIVIDHIEKASEN
jgi:uncharacterized protein (TIGR03435 family)